MLNGILWRLAAVFVFAASFSASIPASAEPMVGSSATLQGAIMSQAPDLVTPAAARLCGRGLSGRCTKGRNACVHGTAAQCARWTAWSQACGQCADAFAACRNNAANSCTSCLAAHDRCEARLR